MSHLSLLSPINIVGWAPSVGPVLEKIHAATILDLYKSNVRIEESSGKVFQRELITQYHLSRKAYEDIRMRLKRRGLPDLNEALQVVHPERPPVKVGGRHKKKV